MRIFRGMKIHFHVSNPAGVKKRVRWIKIGETVLKQSEIPVE